MNFTQRGIVQKQRALNAKGGKFGRKLLLTVVLLLITLLVAIVVWGIAATLGMYNGILASTPRINSSQVASTEQATFVYDIEGNKIDELVATNSNRILVKMEQIPQNMADAVVAIEDERFYEHNGIDPIGIFRAGYQFIITKGKEQQGASTITQQLLKNTIFTEWTEEGDNLIKSVKRKLQEQYLAIELTKVLSKEEILERYMNTINLGQNTLGVEAASQRYFGKSVSELTLSECATIAVITQNPSKWNPISHPEQNAERRKRCLDKMLELEFITQAEYDEAMADNVYERIERHNVDFLEDSSSSSYFVDALTYDVREDLIAAGYSEATVDTLLYSGGLRIMSTMDPKIQSIVDFEVNNPENYPDYIQYELDCALTITSKDGSSQNYSKEMMILYFKNNGEPNFDLLFDSPEAAIEKFEEYKNALLKEGDEYSERIRTTPQPQVSVYIMDQSTGYVAAMSGGRGPKEGRLTFNRATSSYRQPGSTFKVLSTYAPALDSAGLTLASVYNDAPFFYDDGKPVSNWYSASKYKGLCSIRYGIEQSLNIVAVKTLTQITPRLGYDYVENFGFKQLANGKEINGQLFYDAQQPLALGGITTGVSNEELTAAYATIANGGVYTKPKLYTQVLASDGTVLLDNRTPQTHQVIKETTAFLLTDAMVDVVTKGTGTRTRFSNTMAIAGKTGTTSSNVDVWFAGYTPYYTCSTWAGYDNNHKMISSGANQETNIAKNIWRKVMESVHKDLPDKDFYVPTGIMQTQVCKLSGKLPNPGVCDPSCIVTEYFEEDTLPLETCDVHYYGQICAYDNLVATPECPFQYTGTWTMTPVEHESLWSGSTIPIEQPDGSIVYQTPKTSNTCQHDVTFFLDPNYATTLQIQQEELNIRLQGALEAQQQQQQQAEQSPQ
ncbi:MAG: transglycosylase domain-containing protein [Lachnospiraceae bacterium]|nr:transglycosylase domain-containing protein [Lachnospiraceae bacterium]